MRLRGKVGNTTYYTQGGRQIARVSENSSNYGVDARRSFAQQRRRVLWANLVNFYKVSEGWMKGAFETKNPTQSDYNKFMSVNLPITRVALTKEQALRGCSVYDSYIISQGSLHTIQLTRSGNVATSDIVSYVQDEEWATITRGEFSQTLIDYNPWLKAGCQLSFIIYRLDFPATHDPRLSVAIAEFTLDPTSGALFSTLPISPYLKTVSGKLTWNDLDPDAYIAIVVSDSTSGQLKVSSQQLIAGDVDMPADYATEEVVRAAIDTYGLDAARFLDSGYE